MAGSGKSPRRPTRSAATGHEPTVPAVPAEAEKPPSAAALRRELGRIDRRLVALLNERGELARRLGNAQSGVSLPELTEQIARAMRAHAGPLPGDCVEAVLRELLSGCRALVQPVRVAFLGPHYSYSHIAAIDRFGQSAELVPVGTIAAVFEEVRSGQAQYGLVPVENSTDGRVADTLEMFTRLPVQICGEVPLRIHHNLLGCGRREEIREVLSKPQALSQCRNWIARHLADVRVVEVASTSHAAEKAAGSPLVAAIASSSAATRYGLTVLAANIEDQPDNLTRFAVISDHSGPLTGDDKTSLLFEVPHRPGALADAMAIFKRNRLNMTWIESFPIPASVGRYLFFVEFMGHQQETRVKRAIKALERGALRLEVLGSYQRSDPVG